MFKIIQKTTLKYYTPKKKIQEKHEGKVMKYIFLYLLIFKSNIITSSLIYREYKKHKIYRTINDDFHMNFDGKQLLQIIIYSNNIIVKTNNGYYFMFACFQIQ